MKFIIFYLIFHSTLTSAYLDGPPIYEPVIYESETLKIARLGCDGNSSLGCFNLAKLLFNRKRIEEALHYFDKSCLLGKSEACEVLNGEDPNAYKVSMNGVMEKSKNYRSIASEENKCDFEKPAVHESCNWKEACVGESYVLECKHGLRVTQCLVNASIVPGQKASVICNVYGRAAFSARVY